MERIDGGRVMGGRLEGWDEGVKEESEEEREEIEINIEESDEGKGE